MPKRTQPDEEDDSDADHDGDFGDDYGEDEEFLTVPCPYCRADIFEDSPQCPKCGNFVSGEDAPPRRRSWFWAVMMALAVGIALYWARVF